MFINVLGNSLSAVIAWLFETTVFHALCAFTAIRGAHSDSCLISIYKFNCNRDDEVFIGSESRGGSLTISWQRRDIPPPFPPLRDCNESPLNDSICETPQYLLRLYRTCLAMMRLEKLFRSQG